VASGVKKSSTISEMWQDRTNVTVEDHQEVTRVLSIGATVNDLRWPWKVIMHSVSKHKVLLLIYTVSLLICV